MKLCTPCHRQWLRWLDYRQRARWNVGGAMPLARAAEARRANADDWARLIRQQQTGIEEACRRTHQKEAAS